MDTADTYHFRLPELRGGEESVFDSAENLPLVVYFYPKDNTPGCTTEAIDFTSFYNDFRAAGYEVVGISRDSIDSHQKFCSKHNLSIPLLSDTDETVCRRFDVIKEKNMYGKKAMGIERSTFILDREGKIVREWRKVKVLNHAQEVLDFIIRLNFEKHGNA